MPQGECLVRLNRIAIQQMSVLEDGNGDDYKWGHALYRVYVVRERDTLCVKSFRQLAMYTNKKRGATNAPL